MKKLQALMVVTALALGTVTFASASDEKKHAAEKEHKEKKDGHKKDDHKKKEKH